MSCPHEIARGVARNRPVLAGVVRHLDDYARGRSVGEQRSRPVRAPLAVEGLRRPCRDSDALVLRQSGRVAHPQKHGIARHGVGNRAVVAPVVEASHRRGAEYQMPVVAGFRRRRVDDGLLRAGVRYRSLEAQVGVARLLRGGEVHIVRVRRRRPFKEAHRVHRPCESLYQRRRAVSAPAGFPRGDERRSRRGRV